jgi:hypothetical protein
MSCPVVMSSPAMVTVLSVAMAMLFVIMGSIDFAVPFVLNKIYWLTTGIIIVAVLLPVFLMTGRHTKVK